LVRRVRPTHTRHGLAVSVFAALFILQLVIRTILFGNPVLATPA
jgi:hypothetical protein